MINRKMLQDVDDDMDFDGHWDNSGKSEDGWKLWNCNKKEIDYWVCSDADDNIISKKYNVVTVVICRVIWTNEMVVLVVPILDQMVQNIQTDYNLAN